jgi:hypothetical protein
MTHCTEDDLILHYYGEEGTRPEIGLEIQRHLSTCAECSATYRSIEETLQFVVAPEVPERSDSYSLEVWGRIRTRLPERRPLWWQAWFAWKTVALTAAMASVVVASFVAGRWWPRPMPAAAVIRPSSIDAAAGDRVRMAAIGDHLERSERVLLDLVNAHGDRVDVSDQQAWAADLIDSNRLFRDAATSAGDLLVANVLDDLERSLLDVVHGPSTMTPAELDDIRTRVDAVALLFKVRVLADELHEREAPPLPARKTL